MDGNPPVSIIIPSDLVQKFTKVSSRNLCSRDGKHVETLAFGIGSEENNRLTVRHLIFPRQTSLPASVENKGKKLLIENYCFKIRKEMCISNALEV